MPDSMYKGSLGVLVGVLSAFFSMLSKILLISVFFWLRIGLLGGCMFQLVSNPFPFQVLLKSWFPDIRLQWNLGM